MVDAAVQSALAAAADKMCVCCIRDFVLVLLSQLLLPVFALSCHSVWQLAGSRHQRAHLQ